MSDVLVFKDEKNLERSNQANDWNVLIVDDVEDVHESTLLALSSFQFEGQNLKFHHAYTSAEAKQRIEEVNNLAVILLDVVIDNESSGLDLIKFIRERNKNVRIIIRTGQPGQAPEMSIIKDYDINDYKIKTELTKGKLYTSVASAIKSFKQISDIYENKKKLEAVIAASSELLQIKNVEDFAALFFEKLGSVLTCKLEGVVCSFRRSHHGTPYFYALHTSSLYSSYLGQYIDEEVSPELFKSFNECDKTLQTQVFKDSIIINLSGDTEQNILVFLKPIKDVCQSYLPILNMFISNAELCFKNLSSAKKLNEAMYFDSLLNIPNKVSIQKYMDELYLSGSDVSSLQLLVLDIDHFSEYNTALGYDFGDVLLSSIANRLKENLSPNLIVARVGGDTFAILGNNEEASPELLKEQLAMPFLIDGIEHDISFSIGVVKLEDVEPKTGNEVFKCANIALKDVKDSLRGDYHFYDKKMSDEISERVGLLQSLKRDLKKEKLFLVYQPQYNIETKKIIGGEALVRWNNNDKLIPPDKFIHLAEKTGLIHSLGDWVLRKSFSSITPLLPLCGSDFRLAINFSMLQFDHPNFLKKLESAIKDFNFPCSSLELEVTETVGLMDSGLLKEILDELHLKNISASIDDFGTGFSSLSYLEKLKFDRLKIDRSFILNAQKSKDAEKIVEAIIQLGKTLNIKLIAEGVETVSQEDWLNLLGCPDAQGYLFSKPIECKDFLSLLLNKGGLNGKV